MNIFMPKKEIIKRTKIPWWKRKWLVNREMQIRFALSGILIGFISSLASISMILVTFWSFNIWQGQRFPTPVIVAIASVLIFNAGGIFVATILATHKVVGPLFNLMRKFQEVSKANFNVEVKFRKTDELQNIAMRFNEMVLQLNTRNNFITGHIIIAQQALADGNVDLAKEKLKNLVDLFDKEKQ